ncbi:hypothetical protein [Tahibacter caeni]|uniref:hypothetical protein n=1 Tax=Tahibacter caeni TaxID=1453545 RepID=UPI002147B307|nr:hypothetical protein [Tahibacter caeni]
MKLHILLALALACAGPCAFAAGEGPILRAPVANLAAIGGQVLLAQGAEVAPAAAGAPLYPGDRLMTLDGAEALIAFNSGCSQRLDGDSLLTIGEQADCAPPRLVAFQQAIGETAQDDDDDRAAAVVDARNATGTQLTKLTPGQRWAVAAALLIPALYYWDRNRNDDDDRPPVSR